MTLYLSSLILSHFRSHKLARFEIDPRPVALFGPNGAGKTNILEAVSLLSPGRGMRRSSAEDMTRRPESLGWKISAVLHNARKTNEIEIWSQTGQARQLRIDEKAAPQTALAHLGRVLWLIPSMDRLWIEGAEGRRRFLDRMTLSFIPQHAEATLSYEKAMRERNRLLKDMVRDAHWYLALEAQMAQSGYEIHSNRLAALERLQKAQQDAQTAFPAAMLALQYPEGPFVENVQELQQALSDNRARDMAAGRTLIGPHRADLFGTYAAKGVAARDCSTGEQKALLVSLILANGRALKDDFGVAPLLLLDEVAAHLDADRRGALYEEIIALGAQAWMSGTGQEQFETLGDRAQYFHVSDQAGVSQIEAIK